MLRSLFVGLPALILCVALQGWFVSLGMRAYAALQARRRRPKQTTVLFSVMLLILVGNFLQMGMWAVLFLALGEFTDYSTALYHSAVNFSTLGYGDVVMSPRWRLLGPIEASNGILMFGVSTAVMTAAVIDLLKHEAKKRGGNAP